DVHQYWICQEVEENRLDVVWISTADMPGDGMTKSFSDQQKHLRFLKQLGMTDISKMGNPANADKKLPFSLPGC
ncbi:hypothetical protein EJ04DRAFT_452613, partial [Polyplosphaeria fusca]